MGPRPAAPRRLRSRKKRERGSSRRSACRPSAPGRSPPSRATAASSFPTSRCGDPPCTRARCGEGSILKRLFPEEARGLDRYYRFYRRMDRLVTLSRRSEAHGRPRSSAGSTADGSELAAREALRHALRRGAHGALLRVREAARRLHRHPRRPHGRAGRVPGPGSAAVQPRVGIRRPNRRARRAARAAIGLPVHPRRLRVPGERGAGCPDGGRRRGAHLRDGHADHHRRRAWPPVSS